MKLIEATVTKQLRYIFVQKTLTLNFFTHTQTSSSVCLNTNQ